MFELSFAAPGVLPVSFTTTLPETDGGLDPLSVWPDDHFPPRPPK